MRIHFFLVNGNTGVNQNHWYARQMLKKNRTNLKQPVRRSDTSFKTMAVQFSGLLVLLVVMYYIFYWIIIREVQRKCPVTSIKSASKLYVNTQSYAKLKDTTENDSRLCCMHAYYVIRLWNLNTANKTTKQECPLSKISAKQTIYWFKSILIH